MSHSEVLGDKTSIYEILGDMVQPITLCSNRNHYVDTFPHLLFSFIVDTLPCCYIQIYRFW